MYLSVFSIDLGTTMSWVMAGDMTQPCDLLWTFEISLNFRLCCATTMFDPTSKACSLPSQSYDRAQCDGSTVPFSMNFMLLLIWLRKCHESWQETWLSHVIFCGLLKFPQISGFVIPPLCSTPCVQHVLCLHKVMIVPNAMGQLSLLDKLHVTLNFKGKLVFSVTVLQTSKSFNIHHFHVFLLGIP